jgi:hypothetical protein
MLRNSSSGLPRRLGAPRRRGKRGNALSLNGKFDQARGAASACRLFRYTNIEIGIDGNR